MIILTFLCCWSVKLDNPLVASSSPCPQFSSSSPCYWFNASSSSFPFPAQEVRHHKRGRKERSWRIEKSTRRYCPSSAPLLSMLELQQNWYWSKRQVVQNSFHLEVLHVQKDLEMRGRGACTILCNDYFLCPSRYTIHCSSRCHTQRGGADCRFCLRHPRRLDFPTQT